MVHHGDVGETADDDKRERILDAALAKFSAYGFARTSMNDIAEGAQMSRPALYQHFANKEEIFREMLGQVLERAADAAIAAFDEADALADCLDGFLQRWAGDLTDQMRNAEHGADLVEAKAGHAKPVADAANRRVRSALTSRLKERTDADVVPELVDLVLLSPVGLRYDDPSMPLLRRRLSRLAASVAAAADSGV